MEIIHITLIFIVYFPSTVFLCPVSCPYKLDLVEQKIDGLCLKEGLSDMELNECKVSTVGDKKKMQRKISDLVGKW